MKLEWMGEYRDIIGDFYRSANGYSQVCKEELFGDKVKFSPYEIQIMECIFEYGEQHKNMNWYAQQLGLAQGTYSKYVRKLTEKGLVEKYHRANNRKDVILQISALGKEEYKKYTEVIREYTFQQLFDLLDSLTPDQLDAVRKTFKMWATFHGEPYQGDTKMEEILIRINGK